MEADIALYYLVNEYYTNTCTSIASSYTRRSSSTVKAFWVNLLEVFVAHCDPVRKYNAV